MNGIKLFLRLGVVLFSTLLCRVSLAEEITSVISHANDRESISITLYNAGLALVKERRSVVFPQGLVRLNILDVSAKMRPESAFLSPISGNTFDLIEQQFDHDLLTPATLLHKHVGKDITVIRSHPTTGEERRERAKVLAARDGTVLRFADRIETGIPGRITFDSLPTNIHDTPTLSVLLSTLGGPQAVELTYLTGGLDWKANYVAHLAKDGNYMNLSGWVTLTNESGTPFSDAKLQLVAGSVNQDEDLKGSLQEGRVFGFVAESRKKPRQESLIDYHLYHLERPTSLNDNQAKQIALMSAYSIPVKKQYLLSNADNYFWQRSDTDKQKLNPAVFIEFENKNGQLGVPLPAGTVMVYAKDSQGSSQFVGQDSIQHTAKNEQIRLKLGDAFDITAERKQTSFKKLSKKLYEITHRIELRNAKSEPVTVRVQELIPGDWDMVKETQKSTKDSSHIASWLVDIVPEGSAVLEYTVRMR